ncbi:MAG: TldD/PmbA family protein [Myxococcota bacterium]|nr:TldD/PmbA family protein [Myxococcota bacterium]
MSVGLLGALFLTVSQTSASESQLPEHTLDFLSEELNAHYAVLSEQDPAAYYLAYALSEAKGFRWSANGGRLERRRESHQRIVDVDLRVGSAQLDNNHVQPGVWQRSEHVSVPLPLDRDLLASQKLLWRLTDEAYRESADHFALIQAERKVRVESEDDSPDFSDAPVVQAVDPMEDVVWDEQALESYAKQASEVFKDHPDLIGSRVVLEVKQYRRFLVSSQGTRLGTQSEAVRVSYWADVRSEDGARIRLYDALDAHRVEGLPEVEELQHSIGEMLARLYALEKASKLEPYRGPVVLGGRAAGVFFHEVLGHRIEGHRQKNEDEGQTFRAKVGEAILPSWLTIVDDPTLRERAGVDLMGHYRYDDEGVESEPVMLVENGVLRSFLMSRSPVEGFERSNGHGRRQPSFSPVARQGNLMVYADQGLDSEQLRERLLEEVAAQGLEFGLWVESIQGGFTLTGREAPNSFQVTPDYAWKIYVDGRPDELIRGVDLIGTPLVTFERILAAGDDVQVFNGRCGAESGWVPVSASSPAILLGEAELQKKAQEHGLPPLLEPPSQEEAP